ncbi:hypothetical protein GQ457_15G012990 [Hibiscus cannabinus]
MEAWKKGSLLLLLQFWILFAGAIKAKALPYDYTASIEAQYGGGIIKNPELNEGLAGWCTTVSLTSFTWKTTGSIPSPNEAWVQVSEGKSVVRAVFKTVTGLKRAAVTVAESKCCNNTSVEVWVDSVSLQPFTHEEWNSHRVEHIEKTKRRVKIRVNSQGKPVANSKIWIKQKVSGKPVGCATNKNIISNVGYRNWFTSRFTHTTFEDEMKWYSNEPSQGKEDYSVSDSMMALMKQHNIAVRGHNIFWDDPQFQPSWVPSLGPNDLSAAAGRRINSIMNKYKGQVIGWDVVNENLHFNFFESKLGQSASTTFYKTASGIDSSVPLFMNDYNTLEEKGDTASTPAKYLAKLKEIQSGMGGSAKQMGIGLECHFNVPDLPYMRSSLDTLAATKLPIWLTEIDVKSNPDQATFLEQILREGHDHPGVRGMIIWSAWKPEGCYHMCLTDNNFKNLATGDVVDKLLKEWGMTATLEGQTNDHGFFEASLFHGEYEVKISHPANTSLSQMFKVEPAQEALDQAMLLQNVPLPRIDYIGKQPSTECGSNFL